MSSAPSLPRRRRSNFKWIALTAIGAVALSALLAYCVGYDSFDRTTRPFAGAKLYVDPTTEIAKYAFNHPDDAWAQQLAARPHAHWLADDSSVNDLDTWLQGVDELQALPVLVLFRIPDRTNHDCAGGPVDNFPLNPGEYDTWIERIIRQLGHRRAVIIFEPSALASPEQCFNSERIDAMKLAVGKLDRAGYTVYIGAGSPGTLSVKEAEHRLLLVGGDKVQGFWLGTGSFHTNAEAMTFGDALAHEMQDRHYGIDTSRNGQGMPPNNEFCNPPTVGAGRVPTTNTGNPLVDAFYWVNTPELSDGDCGRGDPPAGTLFPEQARRIAEQANPRLPPA